MIIRRRQNGKYASLPNAIWIDDRLSIEAKGMLGYLLSLPHDWQVRLSHLAAVQKVGKDRLQRIFKELIAAGYVVRAQQRKSASGEFGGTDYVVQDEPNGASDATSGSDDRERPSVAKEPQPENPAAVEPQPEKPRPANPAAYKERKKQNTNLNTPPTPRSAPQVDQDGMGDFSSLVDIWPTDNVLSVRAAQQAWQKCPQSAQQRLLAFSKAYLAECKQLNRKVCDLKTYIVERRDERFSAPSPPQSPSETLNVSVRPGSAEWHAWRRYRLECGDTVSFMDAQAAKGCSWTVPSAWPPARSPPTPPGHLQSKL